MAKAVKKKKNIRASKKKATSPFNIYWSKNNYLLLLLGFVILVVGYFFMSMGNWDSTSSLYIAPIILLIGYLIVFPAAILFRKKDDQVNNEDKEVASGQS